MPIIGTRGMPPTMGCGRPGRRGQVGTAAFEGRLTGVFCSDMPGSKSRQRLLGNPEEAARGADNNRWQDHYISHQR